jgi:hypothetical protein
MPRKPGIRLTAKTARELFAYDKASGHLIWKVDRCCGRHGKRVVAAAGSRAGTVNGYGYRQVQVDRIVYPEHNLIWLIVTGRWPKPMLDHEDTDPANNRWANLREATQSQNLCNRGPSPNNRSGLKGVRTHRSGKFQAHISMHLGTFKTAMGAHLAYKRAALLLHGKFANTNSRAPAKGGPSP